MAYESIDRLIAEKFPNSLEWWEGTKREWDARMQLMIEDKKRESSGLAPRPRPVPAGAGWLRVAPLD